MKKLILFAVSILFVSVLAARPVTLQHLISDSKYILGTDTLELYDTLGKKINNSTIKITGSNPSADVLVGYMWIKNTTTTEMANVFVRRVVNYEVPGTSNSFCFGVFCYGPMTNVSTFPVTLASGVIDKSFYADYYPDGHGGLSSITYEFFDNVSFGVPVVAKATIEFHISASGVDDNKLVFKGPYPNPASQNATFEYNLPANYTNSQLVIRNMLGVEVDNFTFENRSGKKSIDVSNYASGIYFYTISVDGKTIQSKKMIVKH